MKRAVYSCARDDIRIFITMTVLSLLKKGLLINAVASAGVLAYTAIGYPALSIITALALPRKRNYVSSAERGPVTMIVPAHNEQTVIEAKVLNIADMMQKGSKFDCIIVDDGSHDGTAETVRMTLALLPDLPIRLVEQVPRQGKMAALQRGLDESSSDIVVFSDAECLWPEDALKNLLEPFKDDSVGATNGHFVVEGSSQELVESESLYLRYEKLLKWSQSRIGTLTGIYGGCLAIRREVMPDMPAHIINDDFYLAMAVARQGKRIEFVPEATVRELAVASYDDNTSRRRRMLRGRLQSIVLWRSYLPLNKPVVMLQVVSHKYLRLALPLTIIGTSASALGLSLLSPRHPLSQAVVAGHVLLAGITAYGDKLPDQAKPLVKVGSLTKYILGYSVAAIQATSDLVTKKKSSHLWQRAVK